MIRLIDLTEAQWLDLAAGVRVEVQPFTSALMLAARADFRAELAALPLDAPPLPPEDLAMRFSHAVARHAITGWEGVGDQDGEPLACTPEGVSALMGLHQMLKAFEERYVNPRLALDAEKNGSSPARNGTSAGAQTTAGDATAPAPSARTH